MASRPSPVHLHAKVRKVGNSLALLIPADTAKKAGLHEGDDVDADLTKSEDKGWTEVFGLLKGKIPYEPFSREDLYDDD